jgi:Flp pilus assembly protein TadG
MMGWSNIWRRFDGLLHVIARCAEGAAAVEFALTVPTMGLVLSATFDLAQLANFGQDLDGAVRAGAGYATVYPNASEAQITTVIKGYSAVAGQPAVTFPNSGAFSPPQYCTCDGDPSGSGTITCNSDTTNGGALCASGPKHYYVTIRAVWSDLVPFMPKWTGMPTSVTRTLTVRVL